MTKPIDVPPAINRLLGRDKDPSQCQWWLECHNPATTTQVHPIYGDVPICDRCQEKVRLLGG